MPHLISIINIFYISFFIFILFSMWVVYIFFKERLREFSTKLALFYILVFFFFCNLIIYLYIEKIILCWSVFWEENFIVKDPNDWVWSLFSLSLLFTLIFFLPYLIFICYTLFIAGFYNYEQILIKFYTLTFFYILCFSFFFLLEDFIFAGISSLAENKILPFEFQLEIENFILFALGTLLDFFFTFNILNMFFCLFLFQGNTLNTTKVKLISFTGVNFILFYWFGGEGFFQDLYFIFFTLILLEMLKWLKIFYFCLSKIKKNVL